MEQIIVGFIQQFANRPVQGSEDWRKGRMNSVGGSEIASLLGTNEYSNIKKLLGQKLEIKSPEYVFLGSKVTRWGNLMEPVIQRITEIIASSTLYETSSIPSDIVDAEGRSLHHYSPDGIIAIRTEIMGKLADWSASLHGIKDVPSSTDEYEELLSKDERIALMEFKCPFKRIPAGVVPTQYEAQPRVGMCVIPITEMCLFVDSVFRKCPIRHLDDTNWYDSYFYYDRKDKSDSAPKIQIPYESPLLCGFIGIYQPFAGDAEVEEAEYEVEEVEVEADVETVDVDVEVEEIDFGPFIKRVVMMAVEEVANESSAYYGMKFTLANTVRMTKMVNGLANSHSRIVDIVADMDVIADIIQSLLVKQLIADAGENAEDELDNLVEKLTTQMDLMRPVIADLLETHDTDEPYDFGKDFGDSSFGSHTTTGPAFEKIMEELIENRSMNNGSMKTYYPRNIFLMEHAIKTEMPCYENFLRDNYIDRTLPVAEQISKWMTVETQRFHDFCAENGHTPVGIMPWKMFDMSCVIVYKDPGYLESIRENIMEFMEMLNEIKSSVSPDKYEDELDRRYPKKKAPARKKCTKTSSQPPVFTAGEI